MLELLLSNQSDIFAAGELHNLPAYIYNDRSFINPPHSLLCMCGNMVVECNFWKCVNKELKNGIEGLRIREEYLSNNGWLWLVSKIYRKIDYRKRRLRPKWFNHKMMQYILGYSIIANDYYRLYNAISICSQRKIIIDSSKWPFRFSYIYNFFQDKCRLIILYRDPKAVVYSKLKRNECSLEDGAKMWRDLYSQALMFSEKIPKSNKIIVSYENICTDCKNNMEKISRFLGVEWSNSATKLNKNIHHIGGSPTIINTSKTDINIDLSYQKKLSNVEKNIIDNVCGEVYVRLINHSY